MPAAAAADTVTLSGNFACPDHAETGRVELTVSRILACGDDRSGSHAGADEAKAVFTFSNGILPRVVVPLRIVRTFAQSETTTSLHIITRPHRWTWGALIRPQHQRPTASATATFTDCCGDWAALGLTAAFELKIPHAATPGKSLVVRGRCAPPVWLA